MILEFGDEVQVRPTAAHCPPGATRSNVLADPHTGRFMPVKGETTRWTTFLAERLRQGEIELVLPAPSVPAAPTQVKEK